MVNTTLPLPILKYLEMETEAIERIIQEYPFYIYPRLAQILTKTKLENSEANPLNFFGFHERKLSQYINSFKSFEFSPTTKAAEEENILVSSESEVSLQDISIEIVDGPNIELVMDDEDPIIDSINSSNDIEDNLSLDVVSPSEEPFDLESSAIEFETDPKNIEENSIDKQDEFSIEIENVSNIANPIDLEVLLDDVDSDEELADKLSLNHAEDLIEIPELGHIKDINTGEFEPLSIEMDVSDTLSDEELANKISQVGDKEADELSTIDENIDPSLTVEDGNVPEESTILELDLLNSEILYLKMNESIHFEVKEEVNYIQPDAFELLHLNEEDTLEEKEDISSEKLEDPVIDQSIESSDSNIKDFTDWLSSFSPLPETLKTDELETKVNHEVRNDGNELDRVIQTSSAQHLLLETLTNEEVTPKINRDDELEGFLKDNFFKAQVEIKKANRKTPSELRIQDEAQLSLQPLDLVSQTMAILHEKQGNISKAIEIYEKLIVLFPEKSSFFALQIENLRK